MEKKRVDSHAGYKRSRIKLRIIGTREDETCPNNHVSSSSSLSACPSKPSYRPWENAFQSPLGRGRKLSLRARFALRAIVCGFLDVDVPSPEPTLRAEYDLEAGCAEPTLETCGRSCLEGGRPIPSAACCLGIVADTARGACRTEPRTGTGIAILLGGWPAPALGPLAERGTNPAPRVTLVSARRGRLLGNDCDCEQPMLDAGRTAGVIVPFPGAEFGVVARGGTEPARARRFSLSAAPAVLSRICNMLSPCTRKGRPASASHAGIEVRRSFSSYNLCQHHIAACRKRCTHPRLLFLNTLAHLLFAQESPWVSGTPPKEAALI
jgi:hypothetical protein